MTDSRFTVRRFSDDFAQVLRSRILSGDLRSGDRLNEVKLSEQYGISRSPIREALQALSGEGLVTFVAGRGAFVGGVSVEDVRELGQVREALETYAVVLVASTATAEQLETLAHSLEVVDPAGAPAPELAPRDFHAELLRLTGNSRLEQYASSVSAQLRLARSHSAARPGRVGEASEEHAAILGALIRRDSAAAAEAMRRHIREATENACAALVAGGLTEHG